MRSACYAGSGDSAGRCATPAWTASAGWRPAPSVPRAFGADSPVARPPVRWSCALRPHRRKNDHVSNRWLIGHQHDETIDAQSHATSWWHAVLQCPDVIGIEAVGLGIAPGTLEHLLLEPAALVVRIVELAEGVRQLAAADEKLKPL